jgi:gamma-glutamyltranspeptidase/glutathione hydrolase
MRLTRTCLLVVIASALASSPALAASKAPVRAEHGMVGSTEANASQAGVAILQQGGNAIDAAVAVGFALAVTHPSAGNLGGGGLMVIRFADGRTTSIDYREVAPARAFRDMYLDAAGNVVPERSLVGPLAAGVPGSVAGLAYVHKKYGKLPWKDVVAPAVALAENGVVLTDAMANSLRAAQKLLDRFPESKRIFLNGGALFSRGDRLVQPDLARTLRAIANARADSSTKRPVADLIVAGYSARAARSRRTTGGIRQSSARR